MTSNGSPVTSPEGTSNLGLELASGQLERIWKSYDSIVVRAYVRVRFVIIHIDLLDLMDRLLPKSGTILDMGCGFGLFSLFLAIRSPERQLHGVDVSGKRIAAARTAAQRLGIENVEFEQADICDYAVTNDWDGIFTLDLLHHVEPKARMEFLRAARNHLKPEGVLVIKDITTRPFHKMAFTWLLDQVVAGPCRVWYQHHDRQAEELRGLGFKTQFRQISDRLPYSHIVFRCLPSGKRIL